MPRTCRLYYPEGNLDPGNPLHFKVANVVMGCLEETGTDSR